MFTTSFGGIRTINITSNQSDYNLFTAAGSPSYATNIVVVIASGVQVYSSVSTTPAFSTNSFSVNSRIILINNGYIYGAGGNGGNGGGPNTNGSPGIAGGNAMSLGCPLIIDNTNGYIFGGGGGGGGGGATYNDASDYLYGGGGGGGSGPGLAANGSGGTTGLSLVFGSPATNEAQAGSSGTDTTGGAGGLGADEGGRPDAHGGDAGAGGNIATAGVIGGDGIVSGWTNYTGGAPGAAGYAIVLNGNSITWLGGNNSTQVKGSVA